MHDQGTMKTIRIDIDGKEYVAIPLAEYRRLTGVMEETVPAKEHFRDLLARNVALARKAANLTQRELAERMRVRLPVVARAESGKTTISVDYVERVLTACKLPMDWVAPPDEDEDVLGASKPPRAKPATKKRSATKSRRRDQRTSKK